MATDPEACRDEIQRSVCIRDFETLAGAFEYDNARVALKILLHCEGLMNATERAAFAFFCRRLAFTRRGALISSRESHPASEDEVRTAQRLFAEYLERQKRHLARLWALCPESVVVGDAIEYLDAGTLLRADEISRLPALMAAHRSGASQLQARLRAYLCGDFINYDDALFPRIQVPKGTRLTFRLKFKPEKVFLQVIRRDEVVRH